jgi:cAMP phosphodiesterase
MSAFFLGENLLELTARYEQSFSIQPIQFLAVLVSHVKPELRQRAYFRNANLYFKINLLQNRYARRKILLLKGLSYEIDLENVDEN